MSVDLTAWDDALDDVDVIARILSDLLRHHTNPRRPGKGGKQPLPAPDAAMDFLQSLAVEQRWATVPFATEVRRLAGSSSTDAVAGALHCSYGRAWYLLAGRAIPTPQDMEQAAEAFRVPPWHFVEYRAHRLAELVREWYLTHPQRSDELVNRLGLPTRPDRPLPPAPAPRELAPRRRPAGVVVGQQQLLT